MFIFSHQKINKNIGLMLIELMISVGLSVLLLSLLLEIYITYQQNYNLQKNMNATRYEAETIIELFRSEIHKAGHIGCANLTPDFPIVQLPPYLLTANNALTTSKSTFTVEYMVFPSVILLEDMKNLSTLKVGTRIRYHEGDIMLVSTCFHAEVFVVDSISNENGMQIIQTTHPLHDIYRKNAELSLLAINTFYIAKSRHDGHSGYSLYLEDIRHRKTELVEGIDNLSVESNLNANAMISGLQVNFIIHAQTFHKSWYMYAARQGVGNANSS